jgi:hypothetical protein
VNVEQGWIEWNGGECPVDPDVAVEVRLRCGETDIDEAGSWFWDDCDDGTIIAYRIVKQEPGK